jgi:hypothetical protein
MFSDNSRKWEIGADDRGVIPFLWNIQIGDMRISYSLLGFSKVRKIKLYPSVQNQPGPMVGMPEIAKDTKTKGS